MNCTNVGQGMLAASSRLYLSLQSPLSTPDISGTQSTLSHCYFSFSIICQGWACRGSGLRWTLNSLTGFPNEALRVTIVTQPCTQRLPFTYMEEVSCTQCHVFPHWWLLSHWLLFVTQISSAGSEVAGVRTVACSVICKVWPSLQETTSSMSLLPQRMI